MAIDYDSIQMNWNEYSGAVVATMQSFLGSIPSNLRALGIEFTGDAVIYTIIYDSPPNDDDFDVISTAICEATTRILTDEPAVHVNDKYLTVPYPDEVAPYTPNWGWVYLRKEPVDYIRITEKKPK